MEKTRETVWNETGSAAMTFLWPWQQVKAWRQDQELAERILIHTVGERTRTGTRLQTLKSTPTDVLSLARVCLLKVP